MGFMCNRCPQRLLLKVLSKLGEDVTEFENDGCPWWWKISVTEELTNQIRELDICGAEALPKFLQDYGAGNLEVAQSIQSMRNEDAKGVSQIIEAVGRRMAFDNAILSELSNTIVNAISSNKQRLLLDISPQDGD